MTYTLLPPTGAGDSYRGVRVIEVTLEESDAGTTVTHLIPHGLGRTPLMVWGQMTTGNPNTDQQPLWYITADDVNVIISVGSNGYVACGFNVYCWTPFPQTILGPPRAA